MAKKLVAVTEIRHDDLIIPAGESLDASKFDKKQLESLYNAGAVRVEGEDTPAPAQNTESTATTVSADQSAEASSPAAKAAPVKEQTNAKSSTK